MMLEKERDEFLEEIYELAKENNKMLRAEKRARWFSAFSKLVWMGIIIGIPLWLYFNYLQPMLGNLQDNIKLLENLSQNNPQIGKQVEPIVQTIKTLMATFGASTQ